MFFCCDCQCYCCGTLVDDDDNGSGSRWCVSLYYCVTYVGMHCIKAQVHNCKCMYIYFTHREKEKGYTFFVELQIALLSQKQQSGFG